MTGEGKCEPVPVLSSSGKLAEAPERLGNGEAAQDAPLPAREGALLYAPPEANIACSGFTSLKIVPNYCPEARLVPSILSFVRRRLHGNFELQLGIVVFVSAVNSEDR